MQLNVGHTCASLAKNMKNAIMWVMSQDVPIRFQMKLFWGAVTFPFPKIYVSRHGNFFWKHQHFPRSGPETWPRSHWQTSRGTPRRSSGDRHVVCAGRWCQGKRPGNGKRTLTWPETVSIVIWKKNTRGSKSQKVPPWALWPPWPRWPRTKREGGRKVGAKEIIK